MRIIISNKPELGSAGFKLSELGDLSCLKLQVLES
jgi:hypothetical protein